MLAPVDPDEEKVLDGGNFSKVVRSGETVRRSAGPWTGAVHELLHHLESVGMEGVPRALGFDSQGREVLSYLVGDVPVREPWPQHVWSLSTIADVGKWLASYHRAVSGYQPDSASHWWLGEGAPGPGEVVCHNDFAPYNAVFTSGRLTGVIDWDVAGPGSPTWDLAFCMWQWIPLHHPQLTESLGGPDETAQANRVRLLCDGYGYTDAADVLRLVALRVDASRSGLLTKASAGDPMSQRLIDDGHVSEMERTLQYLAGRIPVLQTEIKTHDQG
ncbi:MAG: phosphotransferase [Candidatus Nanopelagicales bacterium]